MVQVVWSRRALADIERLRAYVAQFNPLAAQRPALRLLTAGNGSSVLPDRGRPRKDGSREIISTPYLIRHRSEGSTVTIVTVRHGARRPN